MNRLPRCEVIYTDDRQDLVEAASELGIISLQYKGLAHLKESLSKLGVGINGEAR